MSDANLERQDSEDSNEIKKVHHDFDIDPTKREGGNQKKVFKESNKKKIQLTFEHVVIKTIPKTKKCCRRIPNPPEPKVILNDVSGTILPG